MTAWFLIKYDRHRDFQQYSESILHTFLQYINVKNKLFFFLRQLTDTVLLRTGSTQPLICYELLILCYGGLRKM
jgi:hypothetical protein